MTAAAVTAEHEFPVAVSVGADRIVAIATWPDGAPRRTGIVLLQGGALRNVSFERNRIAVRQARRLAARGFAVVRFDYIGIGDSTGQLQAFDINDPPTDQVEAVVDWLCAAGVDDVVVIAVCMGARTALAVAAADPRVVGVALGAMPIAVRTAERRVAEWRMVHYLHHGARPSKLKNLRDPNRRRQFFRLVGRRIRLVVHSALRRRKRSDLPAWVSRSTVDAIATLVERNVPLLVAYGQQDPLRRDFHEARCGKLGGILSRAGELVEIDETFEGVLHGFPTLRAQDTFTDLVEAWIDRRLP